MATTTFASRTHRVLPRSHEGRALTRAGGRSTVPVLLEVVLLIAILVALVAGVVMTSGRIHAQVPTSRVFVESGQTLWAIAARHPVPGQTTEQTADMIAEINGVQGGRVIAGDAIAVPTQHGDQLLTASR